MELLLTTLLFIIGLVVIIKGGDFMVDSSLRLSKITGISHIIIGVTVVSICTAFPELLVNIIGTSTAKADLATGNALGSIICDCGLILGVVLTCKTLSVSRKDFWFKSSLLLISTVLLFVFGLNQQLNLVEAIILFSMFVLFFGVNIFEGVKDAKLETSLEGSLKANNFEPELKEFDYTKKEVVHSLESHPIKDIVKLILTGIVCVLTMIITPFYRQDDMISVFGLVILGIVFVLYIAQEIVAIKNEIKYGDIEEDNTQLKGEAYKAYKKSPQFKKDIFKTIFYYILGGLAVYIGATLLCDNGQKLAVDFLGIDPTIVGLTVVALGTSLPELVTAIISIKKDTPDLALGNMIGASFINATLILGVSGIISNAMGGALAFSLDTLYISIPLTVLISLVIFIPTILKQKTYRWQGVALLSLYILDYVYIFLTQGRLFG